jgi:thiosulfate/3-mercaptopyruvate sulfurtransferase
MNTGPSALRILVPRVLILTALASVMFASGPKPASPPADDPLSPSSPNLIQPNELAQAVKAAQKPVVLYVGPEAFYLQAHIPGAENIGAVAKPEGMEKLRARAASLPKDGSVVIYCGCCPWDHCPNIRPAFAELKKLGFSKVRLLYLAKSFGADWADKGLPVAKGESRYFEVKNLMVRRAILLIAAAALALGVYSGLQRFARRNAVTAAKLPATASKLPAAPALSITDINGAAVRTADYQGKVVLVNFWAAWCVPCADEIPQFIALQKKYQDQGLQVIGISVEDDLGELRDFCHKHRVNYPVVPSDLRIADAFGGVLGLPTTFVIGRDSRIHGKHDGATDFPALEQEVAALLQAPTP